MRVYRQGQLATNWGTQAGMVWDASGNSDTRTANDQAAAEMRIVPTSRHGRQRIDGREELTYIAKQCISDGDEN